MDAFKRPGLSFQISFCERFPLCMQAKTRRCLTLETGVHFLASYYSKAGVLSFISLGAYRVNRYQRIFPSYMGICAGDRLSCREWTSHRLEVEGSGQSLGLASISAWFIRGMAVADGGIGSQGLICELFHCFSLFFSICFENELNNVSCTMTIRSWSACLESGQTLHYAINFETITIYPCSVRLHVVVACFKFTYEF
jgi:hypothetical protein